MKGVRFNATIVAADGSDIDMDEFIDKYVRMIEANGWQTCAAYGVYDNEE